MSLSTKIVVSCWGNEIETGTPIGTPQEFLMKTLEQLQSEARASLVFSELQELAWTHTPSAAYDQAIALGYGHEVSLSCRALAVIRRDHGDDAFQQTIDLHTQVNLDRMLKESIIPGIHLLEKVGGAKLMIVSPEDSGLDLITHLERDKPLSIHVGLMLGTYRIALKFQVKRRHESLYVFEYQSKVEAHDGAILHEQAGDLLCGYHSRPSPPDLRSHFYNFLKDELFSVTNWHRDSALGLILTDLASKGEKIAPRLSSQVANLDALIRYGLVAQLQLQGGFVRQDAVLGGVGERGLLYLDSEIFEAARAAEQRRCFFQTEVPLIERIRTSGAWVECDVVPGPKAAKTFCFLLHIEHGQRDWVDLLAKKGYGGSIVVGFYNIDSGMSIAETGECDAFLLQQHGIRQKDDILDQAQEAMEKAQVARENANVRKLPRFKWNPGYGDPTLGGFDEFLDEQFPLT